MDFRHILITGGAGFVGSALAVLFREHFETVSVTALDNLTRRGSELNLAPLRQAGVRFIHGDVRYREDLRIREPFELLIDCSAETSVHAGITGSPRTVIDTNLSGTINCFEAARERNAAVLFLSTSRVYPIEPLCRLNYRETETRFEMDSVQTVPGVTPEGIREDFPLEGVRSFYGATKLAGELFLKEYVGHYAMRGLINRCGLLTGPHQMGCVEQGVISLWMARHLFQKPLRYIGFGGTGKQVRDLLHVHDLFDLIIRQLAVPDAWNGEVFNVGGGRGCSVSLLELTALCQAITGQTVPITRQAETSTVDIPLYLTDSTRAQHRFGWKPVCTVEQTLRDIADWMRENRKELEPVFNA